MNTPVENPSLRAMLVTYVHTNGELRTERYVHSLVIGRHESCHIRMSADVISKRHAEIYPEQNQWFVRDLESTNGTFLNGERIQNAPVPEKAEIKIAHDGPVLRVELEGTPVVDENADLPPEVSSLQTRPELPSEPTPSMPKLKSARPKARTKVEKVVKAEQPVKAEPLKQASGVEKAGPASPGKPSPKEFPSVTQLIQRYFTSANDGAGTNTRLFRLAFLRVKKEQTQRYLLIIGGVVLLLILISAFSFYQYLRIKNMTGLAIEMFYNMKTLEIQVEQLVDATWNTSEEFQAEIAAKRQNLNEMRKRYDIFLEKIGVFGKGMNEEDRIIFRMARLFGECELTVPEGFAKEVKRYIQLWQTTNRMSNAILRVQENEYALRVFRIMTENNLPPQFMYLALQESDFKPDAVGARTKVGYAKGFWQFMPATASQYGLILGPMADKPVFDPKDERYDFDKATKAAAKYIRFLYNTEAQASGLLVMASYNWGHNNVRKLIQKLPVNPKERNFWRLLKINKVPQQTYDYVYYVFSAAVIGENPSLFGFGFKNPLKSVEES